MKYTKNIYREKGSITIATAIILAAVFMLNIVLYDFVILKINLSRIEPHMRLACNSMLASYDALLAEKYGLYGYNLSSSYLSGKGYDYYFPSVENEIEFKDDFTKPDVIKKQICGLMKLKTPTNIIETVIEALEIFESSEKTCEDHSKCGDAAELLVEMQEITKKIKINVEGYFDGYVACVNGYDNQLAINMVQIALDSKENNFNDVLGQIISMQEQYYNYNNTSLNLFAEQYLIYEKLVSEITAAQKNGSADNAAMEIYRKAEKLLNQKAKEQLNENVKILSQRLEILKKYKDAKDVNIEEIKKIFIDDKVKHDIVIIDIISPNSDSKDERSNTKNDILKASNKSNSSKGEYEIALKDYAGLPSVMAKKKVELQKELYNVNNEDFMDTFSSFSGVFSYWENISFDKIAKDVTEKILIDDYVMSYMTNRIDGLPNDKFNNEIEYIIGGDASSKANNKTVEQKILMIRFALNFADSIMDKEKCAAAESIALAIAAVISMGAGVTLYKYIIISSWALIDSYGDIEKLLEGKSVPIVEIGESDNYVNEIQDYNFYLRLLLLFMDEETKLLRIGDVIQLNMQEYTGEEYKLNGVYNKISVVAVTQMDFIFPVITGNSSTYRREDKYELSY